MEKGRLFYEGKAKRVYETDDPGLVIVSYKDDATAFNGQKKGTITGKGQINNRMSNRMFRLLEEGGVPTHFVRELSGTDTVVKRVSIVPLEVIVRNIAAGSFSKRFGVREGEALACSTVEFSYKNDTLGDPMICEDQIAALRLASEEEVRTIKELARKINGLLTAFFKERGITLVDFKLEFGRFDGRILLADEISPDTCRLWDEKTGMKLDKDRFREDLGGVIEGYNEVFSRL